MRNRFVVLVLCMMLLAGVAAAAKFQPAPQKQSDLPFNRLRLVVRGHGLEAPVQAPLQIGRAHV